MLPPQFSIADALGRPWVADLAVVLILALAAVSVGSWFLDRLRIADISATERFIFSAAAGFAILVMTASALAIPGLFRPLPLRILLAAFTLAGFLCLPRTAPNLRAFARELWMALRREPLAAIPLALAAMFCWFALIRAAAPETSFDAVMVYLPYPQEFLRRGTFSLVELYRGNIPLYGVVYFALGEVLHGESGARMLNYLTLPGLLLATAALARTACRELSRPVFYSALAVCWVATCPILWYQASICYPDLGVALWSTLALQAVLRLIETQHRNWAFVAGVAAGMAAGTKFSGMYWIALCGVAILAGYMLAGGSGGELRLDGAGEAGGGVRLDGAGARMRESLTAAALFATIAAVVFLPWLIRNWINTGDPMHPMFQHLLRHPAIDPQEAADVLVAGLNRQRLPLSLRNLLAVPWWMTFGADRFIGTIGPVFLWTIPLFAFGFRRDRHWLLLLGLLPLFGVFWLIGPQWCRYALPGVPLAAVLGASALANLRFARAYIAALGLLMVLPNLPGMQASLAMGGAGLPDRIPYDVALGVQSDEAYLRANLPLYQAAQYANALGLRPSTAVLAVPSVDVLPAWHTRYRVVDVWENSRLVCASAAPCYALRADTLLSGMDHAGIGLVAIDHNNEWVTQTNAFRLEDPMLRKHFRMRGYSGGVFFFERDPTAPRPGELYLQIDLLHRWALGRNTTPPFAAGESGGGVRLDGAGQANGMLEGRPPLDDTRLALLLDSATLPAPSWKITLGPQPRLSFALARQEWSGADGGELTISVDQQVAATEAAPKDDPMEQWRQIDVDLGRWSGKTVTLSLEVRATKPVKLLVADPVIYARVPEDRQIAAEPDDFRIFDTRTSPVAVSFSPPAVRAGQSYSMSLPAAEWAGQWVDVLITTGDGEPVEVPHFQQLDRNGQVRVAVDPSFYPCEIQVRGVRRSGETRWTAATGSIIVQRH